MQQLTTGQWYAEETACFPCMWHVTQYNKIPRGDNATSNFFADRVKAEEEANRRNKRDGQPEIVPWQPPQHPQVEVKFKDGHTASVDEKLVDLVVALDNLGIKTLSGCQNVGDKGMAFITIDIANVVVDRTVMYPEYTPTEHGEQLAAISIRWVVDNTPEALTTLSVMKRQKDNATTYDRSFV